MCELLGLFGDGFHLFSENSFDSRGAFDRRRKQIANLENWPDSCFFLANAKH